jgi:choline transport protein
MDIEKKPQPIADEQDTLRDTGDDVNVSGHVQELDRSFSIWSICCIGIMNNNAWASGGGTLVVALYNGGGPGVLYGLIAATFFYSFIGLSLAELASAIPSSGNVYTWASVTAGPKYGRICSWFGGWWNSLAWIFGTSSVCLSGANAAVAMYSVYRPDYSPERWHIFFAFLGIAWIDNFLVMFGQRFLARVANASGLLCIAFLVITVLVCAIMPSQTGAGYASDPFVWTEFTNLTGYSSLGFVFLAGMLNGAYAIGTVDGVCHLCEEIPNPRVNVPKGMAAQLGAGFLTTFLFYIAIVSQILQSATTALHEKLTILSQLYGVTSLDDVFNTNIVSLPLAAMYQQVTRSNAGTIGLLLIFVLDFIIAIPGAYVVSGRMLWTLARDDATPASGWLRHVSARWRNPLHAQFVCGCCVTVLGCIYIASDRAFNAFVGTFAILTTLSYLTATLPHLLTGRKYVRPGPVSLSPPSSNRKHNARQESNFLKFYIPSPWGPIILAIASAYIIIFDVIFMFPYSMPVSVATMNYSCVMVGGLTILLALGYAWKRKHGYLGPQVAFEGRDDVLVGVVGLSKEEEEERRKAGGGVAAR